MLKVFFHHGLSFHHRYSYFPFVRSWQKKSYWSEFVDRPVDYLEIGISEGGSGCWAIENILQHPESTYTGIDPWYFSPLCKERALKNLNAVGEDKVQVLEGSSFDVLPTLQKKFDIIYIDGCHNYGAVVADSILMWHLAKDMVVWDDYLPSKNMPDVRRAVRCFLQYVPDQYTVIIDDYQFGIRKIGLTIL